MNKNELKSEALYLYSQGKSYGKIAEQLGISKTTAYSWIVNKNIPVKNVQKTGKTVPNEIRDEQNDIEDLKKELQNEYGTDKEISVLVELRKAELEYQLKMENIDFEREKLSHTVKKESNSKNEELLLSQLNEINSKLEAEEQKSERIQAAMNKIINENQKLHKLFQKRTSGSVKMELDTSLKDDCANNIREYLALEDKEISLQDIETVLENNKAVINAIIKWRKTQGQKKSDYPELSSLKEIKKSLQEMIEDFENDEDIELVFGYNSDFVEKLKGLL